MYKKEPIIGFEEYYIDTNGIIYNKNGSIKKYSLNHSGYCIVNLYVNHKRYGFSVHQLVARQFIENPYNYPQVNHKNGNKEDNSINNLEWCNNQYNALHSFRVLGRKAGICKPVQCIDKNDNICYTFNSLADASRYFVQDNKNFRYVQNNIWRVLNGLRKTYKGYIWKYISQDGETGETHGT